MRCAANKSSTEQELTISKVNNKRMNESNEHRSYCSRCHRPTPTCLCHALPLQRIPLSSLNLRLLILQHPREARKRKRTSTVPLIYQNPLGGEYQEYIGGTYHATEMFNFFGDLNKLNDPEVRSVPARVGWARLSGWLPWMEMGDRTGMLYFHTAGRKLDSYDDLSERMRQEIAKNYPDYATPPPLKDERRNETSWTFFKKVLDAQ